MRVLVAAFAVSLAAGFAAAQDYDLVIANGRVIDPETGLDAVRHVGVSGDRIETISETPLEGARVIDATGRIVAPGFIDLHAHGQNIPSGRMQALDGVTTALELESGVLPVADFYARAEAEGRPVNYGAASSWAHARISAIMDTEPDADTYWFFRYIGDPRWQTELADDERLNAILRHISQGLDEGGLGIGILLGYAPEVGRKEYHAVNALAAARGVPTFTHARFLSAIEPQSSFEGFQEMIAVAAATGAHMHISHLNSISLSDIEDIAQMIETAQATGVNITVEAYPYGAGATGIGAAMFRGENWRGRMGGIGYSDFTVRGEPLDEERFLDLQENAPGTGIVVHFLNPEEREEDQAYLDRSMLFPGGAIASDGGPWATEEGRLSGDVWPIPEDAHSHPRSAGTYGRFLRTYARERAVIDWPEAIARVSYNPALILQDAVPQMRTKGRLQEGADADIVVFDPETVSDQATFERPAQATTGFDYVVVNGAVLVDGGELDTAILPGRPIRGTVANED
jgi:N-acyl-D-glutamate deacylase